MSSNGAARRRLCGYVGVAGPVLFGLSSVIAGLVQSSYSPGREDISALSALTAEDAWIMVTGMVSLGVCTVALACGLRGAIGRGDAASAGPVLILAMGLGVAGAGLMRNDCSTELAACARRVRVGDVSWHHQGHDFVSITLFVLLAISPLVFANAFRAIESWQHLRLYSLLTAWASIALFALYFVGPILVSSEQGLFERFALAVPLTWLAVIGGHLARLSRRPRPRSRRSTAPPPPPYGSKVPPVLVEEADCVFDGRFTGSTRRQQHRYGPSTDAS